ncbi:MAG: hypothetical protein KF849_10010 [Rhizobiaceae bacterium]|nr:hypothetical protein [Rhizobiaceae bacterium]
MSETSPPEKPAQPSLDDPVARARIVRALLITAPFLFVGSYLLAWVQGAETKYAGLIAGVALAGCLGTALSIHLLGSKSRYVLFAVMAVLSLAKMGR